jgi:nifR3 family TIM-barrel protein
MATAEPSFTVGTIPVYGRMALAPMAGYTDQPYRTICRRMGAAMVYTEFVSVQGLLHSNPRTVELLAFSAAERPLIIQIFGYSPQLITRAALRVQELGPDAIDVNMGCPASRIAKRGSGAGLLREPRRIADIFSNLTKELSIPVTAKIRLGWDARSRNHVEIARILEDNGAALIAVHGRTRDETYATAANWEAIAEVKQAVQIPVVGNGDVRTICDIDHLIDQTNCDGVMIGRGAIGNPWIFAGRDQDAVPLEERIVLVGEHLARMVSFYGEKRGVLAFRKHLVQYIRGEPGSAKIRAQLLQCTTRDQVMETLDGFLRHGHSVL